MENTYTNQNNASRQELTELIQRLSEEQLRRPMEAGWTVAGVLAHLAFWDQRALTLLKKWQQEGIGPSEIDTDVVNETTRILCINLASRVAAQLAIDCAQAVDQEIERLDPEFLRLVEHDGKTVRLDRANHRKNHSSEITNILGL